MSALPREAMDVLRLLGRLMSDHGSPAQGMALLQALDALHPGDRWTRRALARACIAAGQPATGLRVVRQLRDGGDGSALAWLLEGQALQGLGRRREARLAYLEYLRLRTATEASNPT